MNAISEFFTLYKGTTEKVFKSAYWSQDGVSVVWQCATKFNIDGRAIVGAVWWELRHNYYRGTLTDGIQLFVANTFNVGVGNGVGWGSMHWNTARALLSEYPNDPVIKLCTRDARTLAKCLNHVFASTYMIAAEMNRAAVAYEEIVGISIRQRPEILAVLYHTGKPRKKARELKALRDAAAAASSPMPEPTIGADAMGKFVQDHLDELKRFMVTEKVTVPPRVAPDAVNIAPSTPKIAPAPVDIRPMPELGPSKIE